MQHPTISRLKARFLPLLGLALAAVLPVAAAAQTNGTLPTTLDHFKCYRVFGGTPPDAFVELDDQFTEGFFPATVLRALRFCNPVTKVRVREGSTEETPLRNPDHHLTLYLVEGPQVSNAFFVCIDNQFHDPCFDTWNRPVALAVPTQKNKQPPPVGLNHFLCYPLFDPAGQISPVNETVQLKDQFHQELVRVGFPVLLCNPVTKAHGEGTGSDDPFGELQKIITPILPVEPPDRAHLVCYRISPIVGATLTAATIPTRGPVNKVEIRNQFEEDRLGIRTADLLCVPSNKIFE